jgi:PAS domain S-box-containing protein
MNWKTDPKLAVALLGAIERHQLPFEQRSKQGISPHEKVNILYHSPNAVLCEDLEGRLIFFNQAAQNIFGYSLEEALGMPSVELAPTELREGRKKLFREVLDQKIAKEVRTTRLTQSGQKILVSGYVFPYELSPGVYSIAAILKKEGPFLTPSSTLC